LWCRGRIHHPARLGRNPGLQRGAAGHNLPKAPLTILFQHYTPELLRVVLAALVSIVSTIFGVYALSYAVNTVKIDPTTMLWVAILTNIVALVAIPLWAILADRVGRRPVFIFGALASGVSMFAYLRAISQTNIPLVFALAVLMSGVVYSASNGVWPCLYGEMFDTRVRLSGMAIGTQIGFALAGFSPAIASVVQGTGPNAWLPVALLTFVVCVIASIAAWTARETHTVSMHDLGKVVLRPSVTAAFRGCGSQKPQRVASPSPSFPRERRAVCTIFRLRPNKGEIGRITSSWPGLAHGPSAHGLVPWPSTPSRTRHKDVDARIKSAQDNLELIRWVGTPFLLQENFPGQPCAKGNPGQEDRGGRPLFTPGASSGPPLLRGGDKSLVATVIHFWSGSHVGHAIPPYPQNPPISQKQKMPASIGASDEH
jgi:Major Facilitator Superfamily